MMDGTVALIRRWTSQEVARTNAAEASASLQRRRQQLDEVDAYVAALAHERGTASFGEREHPTSREAPRPASR